MAGDTKALLDLISRNPTQARIIMHMERLLTGWREALDPDAYQGRLDALQDGLAEGVEQTAGSAGNVDPASKAEMRQVAAAVAAMRTAHQATLAGRLTPA